MRTIKPPPEWQVPCPECHAILAYTCKDTFHNKYHMIDQITCPHCESSIEVPTNESLRTPCDTPPDAD
jgi:transcription elongation factor Elf1